MLIDGLEGFECGCCTSASDRSSTQPVDGLAELSLDSAAHELHLIDIDVAKFTIKVARPIGMDIMINTTRPHPLHCRLRAF